MICWLSRKGYVLIGFINCDFSTGGFHSFFKRNSIEISVDFSVLGKFYKCNHVYTLKCLIFKLAMCLTDPWRRSKKLNFTQKQVTVVTYSIFGSGRDTCNRIRSVMIVFLSNPKQLHISCYLIW